jgi:hypothetical protein
MSTLDVSANQREWRLPDVILDIHGRDVLGARDSYFRIWLLKDFPARPLARARGPNAQDLGPVSVLVPPNRLAVVWYS